MNRDLLLQQRILEQQVKEMQSNINKIEIILATSASLYKNESSIKAIANIRESLITYKSEYQKKNNLLIKIDNNLLNSCEHEILISERNRHICALCSNSVAITESTKLEINVSDYNWDLNKKLKQIIDNYLNSNDEQMLEDNLEELQYSDNIQVRRLKL